MAPGIRRDRPRRRGARRRPGGLSCLRGLQPVMERWEFRRRLAFPRIVAMKPILPHAVKAGISGGIKTEGMPPSFFTCGLEDGVVDPLDEPKPEEFPLIGMRLAAGS